MTVIKKPSLNDICAPIEKDLKAFQLELKRELSSTDPLIRDIHDHILRMSGKFLRPILAILCSRLTGGNPPEALKLGVAAELIHTATLVHDDIIDDSDWRRNQPSVHSRWGRELSIVSGDYLYAKAFMILAGFQDSKISQAFATCAHIMCEGEMKQIEKRKDFSLPEEEYLKIIHKKTAALFQASCAGGAYFASSDLALAEAMGRYGYGLGMAFQIVDDCLDLVGETETMGKKAGLDLTKNDMTLPLVMLFSTLSSQDAEDLRAYFQRETSENVLRRVQKLCAEYNIIDRCLDRARRFANDAGQALSAAPPSAYRDSLAQLLDHCLERAR